MRDDWEYRRGDLYLADLDSVIGAEIGGVRPVLILQNNTGNHFSPTLIAAPLTSNIEKKPEQPTHFLLESVRGLTCPSMVMLEQLKTLDKSRIIKYMGRVDRQIIESKEFRNCLAVSVAFHTDNRKHSPRVRKGADHDIRGNEKCGCAHG